MYDRPASISNKGVTQPLSIPSSAARSKLGFSLIEVTIALMVLSIAATGILSYFTTLYEMRKSNDNLAQVQALANEIIDRISAADDTILGDPVEAPWSQARYEDNVTGDRPPLTATAADAQDHFVGSGLMATLTSVSEVEVYIEYYQGLTRNNGGVVTPGVMDAGATSVEDFRSNFQSSTWRAARRLNPAARPTEQTSDNAPFVVRVIVVFNGGTQRLECFTAKRRPGVI